MSNDTSKLKGMLDKNPSLANAKNAVGGTLLFDAAFFGNKDAVALLIDKGADVNAKDDFGNTPLDKAKSGQHDDIVELLTSHGAKSGKS